MYHIIRSIHGINVFVVIGQVIRVLHLLINCTFVLRIKGPLKPLSFSSSKRQLCYFEFYVLSTFMRQVGNLDGVLDRYTSKFEISTFLPSYFAIVQSNQSHQIY